ncbi:MAG: carbon-nitrogen hydrolase family protein [Armatimonadetes bacterium]|nr:carbon-nitrogen hydrolase family protein [Armatimonadota bacterium]
MARWLRVVSISMQGQGDKERNIGMAIRLLEQAAWEKPDLVCLPETFSGLGLNFEKWFATAETLDGETVSRLSAYARNQNCYVVCPMVLKDGGKTVNASVLIDRKGEVVGYYAKMFPTIKELEIGIVPGIDSPVFQTDFGKVGFAICFDLNFREVAQRLKANGAELVCFVSMYPGGKQVQVWAIDFGFWMVTSISSPQSMVVNPLGRIVKTAQPNYQPLVSCLINLDCVVAHLDYNYEKLQTLKKRYGADAEIEISQPEGRFLLTCNRTEMTVWDWVREFNIETVDDYFARARAERAKALANLNLKLEAGG